MQKFSSFGRKKKNRPKFDIEWICPKAFNLYIKIGGQVKVNISWQELKTRFLRYFAHKWPLPKTEIWGSYFPPEALSFSEK